jgi:hypothetical protein
LIAWVLTVLRDRGRADVAARAGPVLDHERGAVLLLHVLREDAGEHVGRAAGAERHHHGDLLLRPSGGILSLHGSGQAQQGQACDDQSLHRASLSVMRGRRRAA